MKKIIAALMGAVMIVSHPVQAAEDTYISPVYVQYCEEIGARYRIQPEFLEAFIEAESSGIPTASNGSCHGLCQVYTAVHRDRMKRLGVSDIFDPYSNILVAADILTELFDTYGDDTAMIVMMYNGSSDAKRRAESWFFTDYANKVLNRTQELEALHGKHDYHKYLQKRMAEQRMRDKMKDY